VVRRVKIEDAWRMTSQTEPDTEETGILVGVFEGLVVVVVLLEAGILHIVGGSLRSCGMSCSEVKIT